MRYEVFTANKILYAHIVRDHWIFCLRFYKMAR